MDIITHFDEIHLKGNNQRFFCDRLMKNLRLNFPGVKAVRMESGIALRDFPEEKIDQLALIPGIANFSQAIFSKNDLESIGRAVEKILPPVAAVKSFRVTVERSFKAYKFKSQEIGALLGDKVNKLTGWKVDLKNFDFNLQVAIGSKEAVIFGKEIVGVGGLPVGTAGKVLCLLSGGIDSPVAAYRLMVRGAAIELIHFQNQTQVTAEVSEKIFDLARLLANFQTNIKLHVVPFANWQKQIVMKVPADLRMLLTRRLMFRISENLAKKENCLALATGDSLGQVASQTLENLNAVYAVPTRLKLAPLMGMNKIEIMTWAKKLGTLPISERPYEDCCSLFVARHPQTRAKAEVLEEYEKQLDLSTLDKTEIISYHISI